MDRKFPVFPKSVQAPVRPISFVCVRFCNDFDHNIVKSPCIRNPLNEFIVVDNRQNLFYPNLSTALSAGISQAKHDLIALVHEDVLLLSGWQSQFEQSLQELEIHHPDWGLLGPAGRIEESEQPIGHWSDPHRLVPPNLFEKIGKNFSQVKNLDEQLMIMRRESGVLPDPNMPSIHHIGKDLARQYKALGKKTFVINAPSIHKYADENGKIIEYCDQSAKIRDRKSRTYLADHDVSTAYYRHKFQIKEPLNNPFLAHELSPEQVGVLNSPLILLGRGGGGTRLSAVLAQDCSVFIGNDVNLSGDCLDMAPAIYRSVFRSKLCTDEWSKSRILDDLRGSAADMLETAKWPRNWGFKLPETLLILPWIREAFSNARYVYFYRNPENTIFRRSHMTARYDNHIGRVALTEAYDYVGRSRINILTDNVLVRMAITTRHQNDCVTNHFETIPTERTTTIRFEETIESPEPALRQFSEFTGNTPSTQRILEVVDRDRAKGSPEEFTDEERREALVFLRPALDSVIDR